MVLQYLEEGRRKMSKILLKINDVKELSYEADGYILGIDKYSFLFGKTFNIDEIKKIKDDLKKRACQEWCALFVCIVKCRRVKYLQESPMMFGVMS